MRNHHRIPFGGYELTLCDGEEIVIDLGDKSDTDRIVCRENSVYWLDNGNCEIVIDDVYDCETETHLDPSAWYEEEIKPYLAA